MSLLRYDFEFPWAACFSCRTERFCFRREASRALKDRHYDIQAYITILQLCKTFTLTFSMHCTVRMTGSITHPCVMCFCIGDSTWVLAPQPCSVWECFSDLLRACVLSLAYSSALSSALVEGEALHVTSSFQQAITINASILLVNRYGMHRYDILSARQPTDDRLIYIHVYVHSSASGFLPLVSVWWLGAGCLVWLAHPKHWFVAVLVSPRRKEYAKKNTEYFRMIFAHNFIVVLPLASGEIYIIVIADRFFNIRLIVHLEISH